ncbi:MAG: four helix bundle protein [Planctomycetes bacterium]|nr:four helix bundle protein [Planctomycetota bacterium]
MAVQDYRQLEVWQKAMELVTLVYQHTKGFPKEEVYGLTSQLRRAAVSVPSNIAEGQGRRSTKEFLNHLSIARGSLLEVQTQLEIARRLSYLNEQQMKELDQQLGTVIRLLNGLMNALDRKIKES